MTDPPPPLTLEYVHRPITTVVLNRTLHYAMNSTLIDIHKAQKSGFHTIEVSNEIPIGRHIARLRFLPRSFNCLFGNVMG